MLPSVSAMRWLPPLTTMSSPVRPLMVNRLVVVVLMVTGPARPALKVKLWMVWAALRVEVRLGAVVAGAAETMSSVDAGGGVVVQVGGGAEVSPAVGGGGPGKGGGPGVVAAPRHKRRGAGRPA